MEAKAIAKTIRVTPRKVGIVLDEVRGLKVDQALALLGSVNRSASLPIIKVIKSAVANATNNKEMLRENLYIKEIYASEGVRMKRFMARAKGSASQILKRTSHITCVVSDTK
jgi:large subunit ribosomal protein L22